MFMTKQSIALLIALSGTSLAFTGQASALDFDNPAQKRSYCQIYAERALIDIRNGQARGCSLQGVSGSARFIDHLNWCMSQTSLAVTAFENANRSAMIEQCGMQVQASVASTVSSASTNPPQAVGSQETSAAFPPVVNDEPAPASTPAGTPQATNFPPIEETSPAATTSSDASMPPIASTNSTSSPVRVGTASAGRPATSDGITAGDRLIEFGRDHRQEIRHAAHVIKHKLKEKISEVREHHAKDEHPLRDKLKDALKRGIERRLANR